MNRLRFIKNGAYLGFGSMIGTSLLLDGCGDPFSALAIEFLIQEGIEGIASICAEGVGDNAIKGFIEKILGFIVSGVEKEEGSEALLGFKWSYKKAFDETVKSEVKGLIKKGLLSIYPNTYEEGMKLFRMITPRGNQQKWDNNTITYQKGLGPYPSVFYADVTPCDCQKINAMPIADLQVIQAQILMRNGYSIPPNDPVYSMLISNENRGWFRHACLTLNTHRVREKDGDPKYWHNYTRVNEQILIRNPVANANTTNETNTTQFRQNNPPAPAPNETQNREMPANNQINTSNEQARIDAANRAYDDQRRADEEEHKRQQEEYDRQYAQQHPKPPVEELHFYTPPPADNEKHTTQQTQRPPVNQTIQRSAPPRFYPSNFRGGKK